jgi:hypothetical protein
MKTVTTPWGVAQTVKEIAYGITDYSTASHGGIGLSPERWRELKAKLPLFESWAGENWLEEDSDWSAAALVWPEYFTPENIEGAKREQARRKDMQAA